MFSAGRFFGLASFGMCSPKTDSCLVASSVGGSLSFLVPSSSAPSWPPGPDALFLYKFALSWLPISRSAKSFSDRLFWRPGIRFPVPLSRAAASISDRLFWRPGVRFSVPFSRSAASSSDRLFGRLSIRFSGALLLLRHDFFWPAILTPRSPFSGTPGFSFHSLFWGPWSSFSTPSFLPPTHPFPVTWVAGSLLVPPCGTPTAFAAPLSTGFLGALLFRRPHACYPQSSPTSGRTLWWRLVRSVSGGPPFLTLFYTAWLTALRAFPLISPVSLFVHFLHIRGPSIVSSFRCQDTGTACTTASLVGPFGYRKLGNLTYHRLL